MFKSFGIRRGLRRRFHRKGAPCWEFINKMSRATKMLIAVGFVALLGFIIYSTMGLAKINCEVCTEFHGTPSCGLAAGTHQAEAVRSAVAAAGSHLAAGRSEYIAPASTRCNQLAYNASS